MERIGENVVKIKRDALPNVRMLWAMGFTMFFLLNLNQFSAASGMGPEPKYWSAGIFLVTLALNFTALKPKLLLKKPILWWMIGYLLLSMLWLGLAGDSESATQGLILVITTCLYVGTALMAYPHIQAGRASCWWDAMLGLALLLAVASILQEFFNPNAYVFAEAGMGIQGRAAGLYLNPNIAGQALVMILACIMLRSSPLTNVIATVVVLFGLVFTFSRGGMIVWAILVIAATIRGRLPRWFLLTFIVCAVFVLLAGADALDAISGLLPAGNRNSLARLAWLLGQGGANYSWGNDRDNLAAFALDKFAEAPILGHGLGYMWIWGAEGGAHNMILRHMVEYGMIGMLIFPMFLYCSFRSATLGVDRRWLLLVLFSVLILGIFSHDLLEQGTFLFPWLLLCMVPTVQNEVRGAQKRAHEAF